MVAVLIVINVETESSWHLAESHMTYFYHLDLKLLSSSILLERSNPPTFF